MKVYKYWRQESEKAKIRRKDETIEVEIKCFGGSNLSLEDASAQAREKIAKVKRKIAGEDTIFEDYEVEIREELLDTLNPDAVVTRNRYGARVLNVQNLLILDIDDPKLGFFDLFRKAGDPKTQIVTMVKKLAQKSVYASLGFRIYETQKGIRVIVQGRDFDPKDPRTRQMMKEFNCDPLYSLICAKPACYRARLTPKPSVMKIRGLKVKYPRDEQAESELKNWLAGYEAQSAGYAVCKFIEQLGASQPLNDVVRYHDQASGAFQNFKLA